MLRSVLKVSLGLDERLLRDLPKASWTLRWLFKNVFSPAALYPPYLIENPVEWYLSVLGVALRTRFNMFHRRSNGRRINRDHLCARSCEQLPTIMTRFQEPIVMLLLV